MKYLHSGVVVAVLGTMVGCGGSGGGGDTAAQPLGCTQAAASLATNPVSGAVLRITKAEDQAATATI